MADFIDESYRSIDNMSLHFSLHVLYNSVILL